MNSFIETLNQWGGNFLSFAWPMFWQSSLLTVILFAFDFLFRRKIRASVRYALWLVILVKLCVPPTLALPTSPAWGLHKTPPPIVAKPDAMHYSGTYDNAPPLEIPQTPPPVFVPPKPAMTLAAWLLVFSTSISLVLLLWLLVRWWQITRQVCLAATSERLTALADEAQKFVGMKFSVQVKLTTNSMSPAVCGLFRPAILIPQSLVENFSDEQLRAVLLHELIHLRRRDVWVNFLQALLQIFYWWHPLVWVANARIRRVREEAVDDVVMLALRDEAESYAPTLLEVAKLALNRPLASLGLVGIMESRHALRQRIERLVDFRPPRKAGLTLVSLLGILAFTAVAVPMGEGPRPAEKQTLPAPPVLMSAIDAQNTNADRATVIGILSDPNFRVVLHALEQRTGVETLAEPKPTIMSSGRGINRITLTNISVPISNYVSASSSQSTATNFSNMADTNNFFTRAFKVDTNVFIVGLRNMPGLQSTNTSTMARNFFSTLGVDMNLPGKSVYFNETRGLLFVKAAKSDLDTVEHAIQALDDVPLQVHIKARFVEVTQDDSKASGFDWYLGQFSVSNNMTGKGGSSSSLAVPVSAGNLSGAFPSNALALTNYTVTGILTDTNYRVVVHALQQRSKSEVLGEPEVTTISGRRTIMKATTIITVITNFTYQETAINSGIIPQFENAEFGSVLDSTARILSDGYTIDLNLKASYSEFLGYDKTTNTIIHYTKAGIKINVPTSSPRIETRQASNHMNVWDGQTVVLGGMIIPSIQTTKNKVPLLGDLPGIGRLFQSQSKTEIKKNVMVFVTATIVDATDKRIHSDEEMAFAQKGSPPQPQPSK
jgi:beta-lactamase regulating signal transducer with metallopeptidase domain/Flp pilus assembly secretin CpaC